MQDDQFEWDEDKNQSNIEKHGISFGQACEIFKNPVYSSFDEDFYSGELREKSIGMIGYSTVVVVIHTDRDHKIRIISARLATSREKKRYDQEIY